MAECADGLPLCGCLDGGTPILKIINGGGSGRY
jgi:hypothetical protein